MKTATVKLVFKVKYKTNKKLVKDISDFVAKLPYCSGEVDNSMVTIVEALGPGSK